MDHIQAFNTQLVKIFDDVNNCFIVKYKLAGDPPPAIWFNELGIEVNRLVNEVTGKDMVSLIPTIELLKGKKEIGEKIKFYLIELYLKAETKGPPSADFGLWVGLVDTGDMEKELPVAVNRFYLKVWKTEDEKVLKQMMVYDLQQLIAGSI